MSSKQYFFVPNPSDSGSSTPAEDSKQRDALRSHVAVAAHQRRRQRKLDRAQQEARQAVSSFPLLAASRGNADPFDSLPIKLTATISAAINFRRECWLLAILPAWSVPWAVRTQSSAGSNESAMLLNRVTASSYALYCVGIKTRVAENSAKRRTIQELTLNMKSLAEVRTHINVQPVFDGVLLTSIAWLFKSAIIAGEFAEAKIHGAMLRRVLTDDSEIWANPLLTSCLLWHDFHLSLMTMQPSIFNHRLASMGIGEVFPPTKHCPSGVDRVEGSLPSEVREILVRQRRIHWALAHLRSDSWSDEVTNAGFWIFLHLIADVKHLFDYHLTGQGVAGCVAMALVCYLLQEIGDPEFGGKRMFPSMANAYRRLKSELQAIDVTEQDTNHTLFCLYIGYWLELKEKTSTAETLWFQDNFATATAALDLKSWNEVDQRLSGFLILPVSLSSVHSSLHGVAFLRQARQFTGASSSTIFASWVEV